MSFESRLRRIRQPVLKTSVLLEPLETRALLSAAVHSGTQVWEGVSASSQIVVAHLAGFPGLTSTFLSSKVPGAVVLNGDFASSVQVKVVNSGDTVTPAGATISVGVYLRPAGTNGEVMFLLGRRRRRSPI